MRAAVMRQFHAGAAAVSILMVGYLGDRLLTTPGLRMMDGFFGWLMLAGFLLAAATNAAVSAMAGPLQGSLLDARVREQAARTALRPAPVAGLRSVPTH